MRFLERLKKLFKKEDKILPMGYIATIKGVSPLEQPVEHIFVIPVDQVEVLKDLSLEKKGGVITLLDSNMILFTPPENTEIFFIPFYQLLELKNFIKELKGQGRNNVLGCAPFLDEV